MDNIKAGRELDIWIAEHVMGLMPCEEWRILEWDGEYSFFCANREHTTYDQRGAHQLCYPTGVREGDEDDDKNNRWSKLPILRTKAETYLERFEIAPPAFSTDIKAAFALDARMAELGYELALYREIWSKGQPTIPFQAWYRNGKGDSYGADAETAPLAVCRAALKAIDFLAAQDGKAEVLPNSPESHS